MIAKAAATALVERKSVMMRELNFLPRAALRRADVTVAGAGRHFVSHLGRGRES